MYVREHLISTKFCLLIDSTNFFCRLIQDGLSLLLSASSELDKTAAWATHQRFTCQAVTLLQVSSIEFSDLQPNHWNAERLKSLIVTSNFGTHLGLPLAVISQVVFSLLRDESIGLAASFMFSFVANEMSVLCFSSTEQIPAEVLHSVCSRAFDTLTNLLHRSWSHSGCAQSRAKFAQKRLHIKIKKTNLGPRPSTCPTGPRVMKSSKCWHHVHVVFFSPAYAQINFISCEVHLTDSGS